MTHPEDREPEREKDPRIQAISKMGGLGIAMLALCIPLTAILGSYSPLLAALMPLAVIIGWGATMAIIWYSPSSPNDPRAIAGLRRRLDELDKRLASLETMTAFERNLALRQMGVSDEGASASPSAPDNVSLNHPPPSHEQEEGH